MKVIVAAVKGVLAFSVAMLFVGDARAQVPVEEEAGTITMTGTVEEIKIPERVLMVVGPGGRTIVGVVSADVKDIKKIKLKDTVTIKFTQEVAVALRKPEGVPEATEDQFEESETEDMGMNAPTVAEQNWTTLTPAGGDSDETTIEVTATIAALNKQNRTVTFAGNEGRTRTIYVPPTVPGFDRLQVGDMIVIEVTRTDIVDVKTS
jgi:hypothetical protein